MLNKGEEYEKVEQKLAHKKKADYDNRLLKRKEVACAKIDTTKIFGFQNFLANSAEVVSNVKAYLD